MKKILLLATAFVFTLSAMAQPKADDVIKVNTDKHDFGKVIQGTPVTYAFEIKNISDKPIVVENSWASCGCTTPEKITDPIMPGATAQLKVQYNAANAAPFTKDVYIKLTGVEQPKTVQITGEVLTAEAYEVYMKDKKPTKELTTTTTAPAKVVSKDIPVPAKTTTTNTAKPKLSKGPGSN